MDEKALRKEKFEVWVFGKVEKLKLKTEN